MGAILKVLRKGLTLLINKCFSKKIIELSLYKALRGYIFICIPVVFVISEISFAKAPNESKLHAPHAQKIISIRPGQGDNGLRVHIIADGKIKDFKSFRLFKPHRFVVDIPGVQNSVWYSTLFFESSLVKRIRLGTSYKKKVRVVFDLYSAKNLRYKVHSRGNHLIVDFGANASSPIVERAQKVQMTESSATPGMRNKAAPGQLNSRSSNPAGKILSVELEAVDHDTKVHFVGDTKLTRYKYFHLFNPPRFVIDLLDVQSSVNQTSWHLNNPLVEKIRLGTSYKDKVRVVFDLVTDTELPYKFFSKGNHLTLAFGDGYKVSSFKSTQKVKKDSPHFDSGKGRKTRCKTIGEKSSEIRRYNYLY
jgi:cytochrome c oxidase assembly protein Cox11